MNETMNLNLFFLSVCFQMMSEIGETIVTAVTVTAAGEVVAEARADTKPLLNH